MLNGIIADGSANVYIRYNVVFIAFAMSSESCIDVIETWFFFSVEAMNEWGC